MELIKWKRGGQWIENDEGYHYRYCGVCGGQAEHDFNGCVDCYNREIRRRANRRGKQTAKVGEYTVTRYPNGKRYCTCKGFKYRKQCKHTAQAVFN